MHEETSNYTNMAVSTNPLHLPQCSILLPPVGTFSECSNAISDDLLHGCSQFKYTGMRAHISEETKHDRLILACHTNGLCHNA